jgi:hypothetical protein
MVWVGLKARQSWRGRVGSGCWLNVDEDATRWAFLLYASRRALTRPSMVAADVSSLPNLQLLSCHSSISPSWYPYVPMSPGVTDISGGHQFYAFEDKDEDLADLRVDTVLVQHRNTSKKSLTCLRDFIEIIVVSFS